MISALILCFPTTLRRELPMRFLSTLPVDKVLNVALSPAAERKLHARLNDTIVLISRNHQREHLAHFVDRTAQDETRSVVDVLFADAHQARIWGRQTYFAVNLSGADSPFRQQ